MNNENCHCFDTREENASLQSLISFEVLKDQDRFWLPTALSLAAFYHLSPFPSFALYENLKQLAQLLVTETSMDFQDDLDTAELENWNKPKPTNLRGCPMTDLDVALTEVNRFQS